jgi:iron complex transport system ATP-binding protein
MAICGPNGAGKSTLLSVLAGELVPTTGMVALGGDPMLDLSLDERARRRSYLPYGPPSDLPYKVEQIVAMGRHPWRAAGGEDSGHLERAMQITGVEGLSDRVMSSLSSGEAQLAHVARVLAQAAPVLVLDEPTAGLDIALQERILQALIGEAGEGGTVIVAIHDLNAVASAADRVVLMSAGAAVAIGEPSEVLVDSLLSEAFGHPISVVPHPLRPGPLVVVR